MVIRAVALIASEWMACQAATAQAQVTIPSVEVIVEEALPPFQSWGNVVSQFGASGNGIADDTAAIQSCLNAVVIGRQQVCYLPAGTYKISSTLSLRSPTSQVYYSGRLIGADPATTKILWAGPAGGTMLLQNGGFGATYERITWDGAGTAQIGVAQWWNAISGSVYEGSALHQDEVFQNMAIGINPGRLKSTLDLYGSGDSEGLVKRVTFINNSFAGLDTGSFNALDWWVWESTFINCARGYSNNYAVQGNTVTTGAGAAHIYRSNFFGSTFADYDIGNTGGFTLNHNFSSGSAMFLNANNSGENAARFIVQGNRVVNLRPGVIPISIVDAGPLVLVDNQLANLGSSVFSLGASWIPDADAMAIGNASYGAWPVAQASQRIVSIDNSQVQPGTISTAPLSLPATPSLTAHAVFEVRAGASAATIQAAINSAIASADPQAIVHFGGNNTWNLTAPLSIPVNSHVQLVGDGWASILNWTGTAVGGPMIQIACPAKVTIRELAFTSNSVTSATTSTTPVVARGCDSPGGRVQIVGSSIGGLSASGLSQTRISLQANGQVINALIDPAINSVNLVNDASVVSIGSGGFGPLTMSGSSNFVLENIWTETTGSGGASGNSLFNVSGGTFTLLGGELSPGSHGGGTQNVPPITINASPATQSYIGVELNLSYMASGVGGAEVENELPSTNASFFANVSLPYQFAWFSRPGPSLGTVAFDLNRQNSGERSGGPGQLHDQGNTSDSALLNGWAQARALTWDSVPYTPPAGATDLRLYRVYAGTIGGVVVSN